MRRKIFMAAVLLLVTGTLYAAFTFPAEDIRWGTTYATKKNGDLATWCAEAEGLINAGGTFAGGTVTSDVTMANGIYIQSHTTAADASAIQVYDDNGAAFYNALSWTNGNTPAVVLGATNNSLGIYSTAFNVSTAGAVTGVTTLDASGIVTALGGVTLQNAGTLTNSAASEITLTSSGENLTFDMDAGTNIVGLKSSTGVNKLELGTVDDINGVGTVTFDDAASTVTLPTNAAAQDLTIGVTGATDSSLKFVSSGTGADAISLITSAGGMDLTVVGAAAGEDIDITADSSIKITSTEAVTDAVVISASTALGGIDITSNEDIDITTTGAAGEDISITNSGGSVNITATENLAGTIVIATTGGGGTSEDITLTNDQGTGEGAITITATAGGIDLNAATGKNVDILGGQFIVLSNENVANAIYLRTNTGTTETINLTNTLGTAENAINVTSTAGGVDIDAALLKDVALDGGQVLVTGKDAVANQIYLNATGTVAGNAINLATTNGGIVLTAGNATNGDITVTAGDAFAMNATGTAVITSSDWGISTAGVVTKIASLGFDNSDAVYTATTAVSSAEILALFTTAKTIVAGGGANTTIVPLACEIHYIYSTTAYTINGSTNLQLKYVDKNGVACSGTIATTGFIDQAADMYVNLICPAGAFASTAMTAAQCVNTAVALTCATANPTLGVGTLRVKLIYCLRPTTS